MDIPGFKFEFNKYIENLDIPYKKTMLSAYRGRIEKLYEKYVRPSGKSGNT